MHINSVTFLSQCCQNQLKLLHMSRLRSGNHRYRLDGHFCLGCEILCLIEFHLSSQVSRNHLNLAKVVFSKCVRAVRTWRTHVLTCCVLLKKLLSCRFYCSSVYYIQTLIGFSFSSFWNVFLVFPTCPIGFWIFYQRA